MSSLIHTIYASRAVTDFSKDDIVNLLSKARKKNASLGITGMLLYDNGSFFQILEGEEAVLDQLFNEITADKRHHQIAKIISEAINVRIMKWFIFFVICQNIHTVFQKEKTTKSCNSKVAIWVDKTNFTIMIFHFKVAQRNFNNACFAEFFDCV